MSANLLAVIVHIFDPKREITDKFIFGAETNEFKNDGIFHALRNKRKFMLGMNG